MQRTHSTTLPNKFWHNPLGKKVEIVLHENIEEVIKDGEVSYESDMSFGLVNNTRDDIISGFIRLKYSVDKEFALTNKGLADQTNEEYLAYRNYVAEVKTYVGE